MQPSADEAAKIVYNGFIAQEVEAAATKLNYDFSGVDKPQTKDGLYGLRYAEFVVPLVKAVQELSQQNEDLKKEVDNLKSIVLAMQSQMLNGSIAQQQSSQIIEAGSSARLEQNTPNPFSSNTIIRYYIPSNANSAQIIVSDVSGHELKTISLSKGVGQTAITAGTLAAGNYNYTLIVDGKKVDAKHMERLK
jgi:hypothetical protein